HGGTNGPKQLQTYSDREALGVAVVIDGSAGNVLHYKERQPPIGHAAVEQSGNVRVIQISQNLALVAEAIENEVRVHSSLDQLYGDLLLKLIICPNSQANHAHTAAADFASDLVRANRGSDGRTLEVAG